MSSGKVMWHFALSLDGFIAAPDQSMDWMEGTSSDPGIVDEVKATVGAILTGRRGYDAGVEYYGPGKAAELPYGGAWRGPVFVLTSHPEDAVPDPALTFLNCDIADAIATALDAAGGKNVELFSADIGRQALQRGLLDEFWVHLMPVMLGDGIRLLDCPGMEPVKWERIGVAEPRRSVDLRYRPVARS